MHQSMPAIHLGGGVGLWRFKPAIDLSRIEHRAARREANAWGEFAVNRQLAGGLFADGHVRRDLIPAYLTREGDLILWGLVLVWHGFPLPLDAQRQQRRCMKRIVPNKKSPVNWG